MKITEYRAYEILCWLDDQAGDHTNLFEQMTLYRDAAALIRQLRDAEQSAWHAGLDAGRELGRGKERAGAKASEIEALKVEVAAQRARADAMAGEAIKHEARAERLRAEVTELKNLRADAIHECALANVRAERLAEALRLIESAKGRGFGIDYARGVAQSTLRDRGQEVDNG